MLNKLTCCQDVGSEEWPVKLGTQSQEVGLDTWVYFAETSRFGGEIAERTTSDDAMWVVADKIILGWLKISGFLQTNGKVVSVELPDAPISDPLPSTSARSRGSPVKEIDPAEVCDRDGKKWRQQHPNQDYCTKDRQNQNGHDPLPNSKGLQSPREGNADWSEPDAAKRHRLSHFLHETEVQDSQTV